MLDIFVAEAAVAAVGQHHQIRIGEAGLILDVGLEQHDHAEFAGPLLQDQQQRAARAAAETVAADPVHGAAEVNGDVVPVGELLGDAAIARSIVFFEVVEGRIGEHDAEAEGVVGTIALMDRNLGPRPLLLEQDRGIQTGRSATDDRNLHGSLRRRGTVVIILTLKQFSSKCPSTSIRTHPEVPRTLCAP